MADDEFDIDIYGDGNEEDEKPAKPIKEEQERTADTKPAPETVHDVSKDEPKQEDHDWPEAKQEHREDDPGQQQIKSTDEPGQEVVNIPKQAPQQQGVKRKEGSDDRPIDNGATSAILISDLHWWTTDDDIRGWVNQAQCEDELQDITFSEHKVNGKSKG